MTDDENGDAWLPKDEIQEYGVLLSKFPIDSVHCDK